MTANFPGLTSYPASRVFSLAWLLAFTRRGLSVEELVSHANDFVNAKTHAREKPLLAGYYITSLFARPTLKQTTREGEERVFFLSLPNPLSLLYYFLNPLAKTKYTRDS